jgi:hypothetical protein
LQAQFKKKNIKLESDGKTKTDVDDLFAGANESRGSAPAKQNIFA